MGASQSRPEEEDKVFYSDTPIQFSEDIINQLADQVASPEPSPERQSTLDSHVRARIQSELERLRQEEEIVKSEIERALEKENLDKEISLSEESEDGSAGSVKSSAALLGDLEEIRHKVEKYQRTQEEATEFQTKSQAVASCYSANPTRTLDCWKEVAEFKDSVAQLEQHYVHSLR
ncbi:unnamed protein product [Somion occarium]|uniref:DUF1690 domain-containing protein n=1 Tax=Somion occarium TaxID=3059160 RepID=A0ABP1DA59_9APHY